MQASYIIAQYRDASTRDLAAATGASLGRVRAFMKRENLRMPVRRIAELHRVKTARPLTVHEYNFIKENYPAMGMKQLAAKLNRCNSFISHAIHQMGMTDIVKANIIASRIALGSTPANKGKKITEYMSPEAIAATAKNRFKKGHTPGNTLHNGAITLRVKSNNCKEKYYFIRLSLGKWDLLHRHLYRQHYGDIPKGYVVAFKDGNSLNCEIDNLELLTRKQNMLRNSIMNLDPAIRTNNFLIKKIQQKIDNYE